MSQATLSRPETSEQQAQEPILVIRLKEELRKHPARILKVWVKRFVENGDQVTVTEDGDKIIFQCPDYLTELYVMMLCDKIKQFGYAKPIFPEVT